MDLQHLPTPQPPPREYWDARDWLVRHYEELVEQFPDQWVAILDGRVIASGKDAEVEDIIERDFSQRSPYVALLEWNPRVYSDLS